MPDMTTQEVRQELLNMQEKIGLAITDFELKTGLYAIVDVERIDITQHFSTAKRWASRVNVRAEVDAP